MKKPSNKVSHKKPFAQLLDAQTDPFALGYNAECIYQDSIITETVHLLAQLIQNSTNLILIKGAEHSGKSTHFRLLRNHIQTNCKLVCLRVDSKTNISLLLKKIAQGFGVTKKIGRDLRVRLFHTINELTQENIKLILIVDDAHKLNSECLQLLADFNHEPTTPLSITLFSECNIDKNMKKLDPSIRIGINAHLINLKHYNTKQTLNFINHHLKSVGIISPFILNDVQIARLQKQADGLPGKIKILARELFRSKKVVNQIKALLKIEKQEMKEKNKTGFINFLKSKPD